MRYDWYQSGETVTVEIFVKGLEDGEYAVTFEKQQLVVRIKSMAEEMRIPLSNKIVSEACNFYTTPMKLVITLRKVEATTWKKLELSKDAEDVEERLSYPSSSKVKHDWESLDKSANLTEEEPQSVDLFFKKLYANASEETQRAMTKSFVESQGTVLSTNWNDVGSSKVKPALPKGMKSQSDQS